MMLSIILPLLGASQTSPSKHKFQPLPFTTAVCGSPALQHRKRGQNFFLFTLQEEKLGSDTHASSSSELLA